MTKTAKTFIYAIHCPNKNEVKIGYATDPLKRLAQLQTATTDRLDILLTFSGNIEVEKLLHSRLDKFRLGGEWFIANSVVLKTNQSFTCIPTGRLKDRIKQMCELYGIEFIETEESYTSKASFVDRDFLPTFGEKPEGWKESGKRIKRGLYRTAQGHLINADCNGAANILRKVATILGLSLDGVSRGALAAPQRIRLNN